jgi:hypothetical protein
MFEAQIEVHGNQVRVLLTASTPEEAKAIARAMTAKLEVAKVDTAVSGDQLQADESR